MMDDGRCAEILDSGEPCGGYAVTGSIYCFTHDPKSRQKRLEARSAGGKAAVKSKKRQKLIAEVVGVAQTVPMFPPAEDLPLDTMADLRTFAVEQANKLRLDGRQREELRRWMSFLLDLSKAEGALQGKDRDNDSGRAGPSPEPNTLAWLDRIARGSDESVEGSTPV